LPDPDAPAAPDRGTARASETANGRILVRVPRSLHAALLSEADAEGVSLNQLIVAKLTVQLRAAV
jgi:predicted HicB family RNase H-like nuclease